MTSIYFIFRMNTKIHSFPPIFNEFNALFPVSCGGTFINGWEFTDFEARPPFNFSSVAFYEFSLEMASDPEITEITKSLQTFGDILLRKELIMNFSISDLPDYTIV